MYNDQVDSCELPSNQGKKNELQGGRGAGVAMFHYLSLALELSKGGEINKDIQQEQARPKSNHSRTFEVPPRGFGEDLDRQLKPMFVTPAIS